MNRAVKFLLIVALCLILIGGALFAGVMAKHNWDLASLSKDDYETRSYPVTEDFRSIDIRSDTENISFVPSDDGTCRVEITEKKEEPHTVTVKDGTLRIEKPKDEGWSISFFSLPLITKKGCLVISLSSVMPRSANLRKLSSEIFASEPGIETLGPALLVLTCALLLILLVSLVSSRSVVS